ncbi:hypothetical protein WJX74_002091 [Apatococcus lobatus]|uniref:Glycoside hydrolase family 43 protein n=1 Tax=Apatococcus lobatus TaxID=904363 RepID=A0AAW1RIL7_9CHLO
MWIHQLAWTFQAARAPKSDLGSWTLLDYDALPFVHSWSTLQGGFVWAPEVAFINGHFIMYITLHYTAQNRQAIGIATSPTASGPYMPYDTGYPFISQYGDLGALDAFPFLDSDGSWYMYWRAPGADGIIPHIYVQAMTPDGLSLTGIVSDLLAPSQPWEFFPGALIGVIEAPAVTKCYDNAAYCLFYSGNPTQTAAYSTGVAVSSSPYGPFLKYPNNPLLLANGAGILGPGGLSFMLPGNGQTFAMYHSWDSTAYTARVLNMVELSLNPGLPMSTNLEVSFVNPTWQVPVCQ